MKYFPGNRNKEIIKNITKEYLVVFVNRSF